MDGMYGSLSELVDAMRARGVRIGPELRALLDELIEDRANSADIPLHTTMIIDRIASALIMEEASPVHSGQPKPGEARRVTVGSLAHLGAMKAGWPIDEDGRPVRSNQQVTDADARSHQAVTAWLDNDNVSFTEGTDGDEDLLNLHPSEVQEQALALLGFQIERV